MSHQPARRACTLFVNSNSEVLSSMLVLFRRKYDVLLAKSCSEALDILKKHKVDVVVCEQHMPVMSGAEFLRMAAELQPKLMRVLLIAYEEMETAVHPEQEGESFRVVNRDCSKVEMVDTLNRALKYARALGDGTDQPAKADASSGNAKGQINGNGEVHGQGGTKAGRKGNGASGKGKQSGIMILDNDPDGRANLEKILRRNFSDVHATGSVAECTLHLLRNQNVGVFVTQANVQGKSVDSLLSLLRQYQPRLVTIIITNRAGANDAIRMIDEGHAYRFLVEPLREGITKISVASAMRHHSELAKPPQPQKRSLPAENDLATEEETPSMLRRLRNFAFREDLDVEHHR